MPLTSATINFQNIRNEYPALKGISYFNTCSSGLFSNDLLAFRRQLDEDYQLSGSHFRAGVYQKIFDIKVTLAEAFGAKPEGTALIPSCSHGLNLSLEALANGQKVLHLKEDYPSIIWPFESRNFACLTIDPEDYSEAVLAKQIQANNIDILALSMVQYSNGAIISAETFRSLKARFPNLLIIVDATQFLGTAPFDFQKSGIDLFAASAFKWLCAGYGNGVLFFSERMEDLLQSKVRGYNTYKNPKKAGTPSLGEYFEPGHQDLLAFQTLQFQADQFNKWGLDQIQNQIQNLKELARKRISEETPFEVLTPLNLHLESGILSVDAPKELVQYLNQNQVICSYNRGLRLGIHFYNEVADVERLVKLMKAF